MATVRNIAGPWASYGVHPRGALTTALTGTNNDLTITAVRPGVGGNSTTIAYVVAGANTPLSVSRSGSAITVNVATNGSSVATSTAAQVRDAINASDEAKHLVKAENAAGNDGTGVVTALSATALTGGADASIGKGSGRTQRIPFRGTNANG
jgi:hypothetical protein